MRNLCENYILKNVKYQYTYIANSNCSVENCFKFPNNQPAGWNRLCQMIRKDKIAIVSTFSIRKHDVDSHEHYPVRLIVLASANADGYQMLQLLNIKFCSGESWIRCKLVTIDNIIALLGVEIAQIIICKHWFGEVF